MNRPPVVHFHKFLHLSCSELPIPRYQTILCPPRLSCQRAYPLEWLNFQTRVLMAQTQMTHLTHVRIYLDSQIMLSFHSIESQTLHFPIRLVERFPVSPKTLSSQIITAIITTTTFLNKPVIIRSTNRLPQSSPLKEAHYQHNYCQD